MNNNATSQNRRPWFVIMPISIGALMASVNLSEWYRVGVIGNIAGYPFGGEGPVPYFYKNSQLYSIVSVVFGGVWAFVTLLGLWSLLKRNGRVGLITAGMTLAVILVEYFNGQIPPY